MHSLKYLKVSRGNQYKVTWYFLRTDHSTTACFTLSSYRILFLLHGCQKFLLSFNLHSPYFINIQHTLVGTMNHPGLHTFVCRCSKSTRLVRIVPYITKKC